MCQQKEAAADDHGLMEIYQQMMTIDLFQTQYGGWFSNLSWPLMVAMLLGLMAAISFGTYFAYLHWDWVKKPMKKRTVQETTNKNKTSPQHGKTPRKSDKKLAEADKDEKASQAKTDIGKELIKTAQNLEDIHEKIEESNKPVKGMEKLEKVKTAHDKLEKVKKELDEDK